MADLPHNVYSVAAVRAIDRCAIETAGIPGFELMTRAGQALFEDAVQLRKRHWAVLCGSGNNAGDGYVIARLAHEQGLLGSLIAVGDPTALRGDALRAKDAFVAAGGEIERWSGRLNPAHDLLIDAVLGSGICREVTGLFRAAIKAMNEHAAPVYAVDIPSGLDGDTGCRRGVSVAAQRTMSFVGLKAGFFLGHGPDLCGALRANDLQIPATCFDTQVPILKRLSTADLKTAFPPRIKTANKGLFGHVAVIGGGPGMPGAARLAGVAALRAGAGRVTIGTHPQHAALITAASPELMSRSLATPADVETLLQDVDSVVFGPGLGQDTWARDLYSAMCLHSGPAVWDADALNLLAQAPEQQATRVLTPHPGEAGRLLGISTAEVQADRLHAVRELQRRYAGTIVLKGAGSLIADAEAELWLCTDGNPGMAAPGMGDVLSGIIGTCLAQNIAARLGVLLHARAGDSAAKGGQRGMLASDLFPKIREEVNPCDVI